MKQIPLPRDWLEQVQEAYNKVLAETMIEPEFITIPIEWMQAIEKWRREPNVQVGFAFKFAFGFVDRPFGSVTPNALHRYFLTSLPRWQAHLKNESNPPREISKAEITHFSFGPDGMEPGGYVVEERNGTGQKGPDDPE
jgi:hypothetical protein